jgi:hypothetical protein
MAAPTVTVQCYVDYIGPNERMIMCDRSGKKLNTVVVARFKAVLQYLTGDTRKTIKAKSKKPASLSGLELEPQECAISF